MCLAAGPVLSAPVSSAGASPLQGASYDSQSVTLLDVTGSVASRGPLRSHPVEVTATGRLVATLEWSGSSALELLLIGPDGAVKRTSGSSSPIRLAVDVGVGDHRLAVGARTGSASYRLRGVRAPRLVGSGEDTLVTHRWAPTNLAVRSSFNLTEDEAVELALDTDVITAVPGALDPHLEVMHQVNPRLEVLVYLNATFAQREEENLYPDHWYARDRRGDKIRSNNYGNWLMNPLVEGWIQDRAAVCGEWMQRRGYEGCFFDMLGSAPLLPDYGTGIPLDPRTGVEWTPVDWHAATAELARRIKAANPGATILGNGAANGFRYFDDSQGARQVVDALDGAVAELWMRRTHQPINRWPTEEEWKQDVDMLVDAEARGRAIYTLTRVGVPHSHNEADRWHRLSVGSFLLGAQGRSRFAFTEEINVDPVGTHPLEFPDLGEPVGPYRQVGEVYLRQFQRALVVVNPTSSASGVDLGTTLYNSDGQLFSGWTTVPPHDALILLRA